MALSPIEDRYLSNLTAAQFPDMPVAETQQPVADATQFDGMQLAAAPTKVVSDAGGGMGEIKATPRNPVMGGVADFVRGVRNLANQYEIKDFVPLLGGMGVGDLLLGKSPEELEEWAYGNAPMTMPPSGTGGFVPVMKTGRKEQLADTLFLASDVSGLGKGAGTAAKAGVKAAMAVGRAGERLAEKTVPEIMKKGGTMAELLQALSQGSRSQLTAYHGTPHRVDQFDSKKIGTGEGNQTYGYGLYFAENPDVAKSYMAVSPSVMPPPIRTFKGAELEPGSPEYHAASLLDGMSLAQARKTVAGWLENPDPRMTREAEGWRKTLDTLNSATSKADFKQKANKGNLYTVDIPDAMVSNMLDWDKPIGKQSAQVRSAIQKTKEMLPPNAIDDLGGDLSLLYGPDVSVSQFLNTWEDLTGKTGSGEIALQKVGVPGVRYLDAGSRQTPNITNKRLASLFEKHNGDANAAVDEMMRSVYNTPKKKEEMRAEFMRQLETGLTRNIVVFPGGEDQVKILKQEGNK